MAYTRHGHHIEGTIAEENPPSSFARCGGPDMCRGCNQDVAMAMAKIEGKLDESEKASEIDTSQFVDKLYEMDPETEDVLLDGTHLQVGMKVLIESPRMRANLDLISRSVSDLERARLNNRWCVITDLVIDTNLNSVRFIGLYDNAIKRARTVDLTHAWIVKKDSIPQQYGEDDNYGAHMENPVYMGDDNYLVREFIVKDHGTASIVLDVMNNFISQSGFASVKDLSSLVDIPSEYRDKNRGWRDLQAAEVIKITSDAYCLKLPPTVKRHETSE